MCMVGFEIVCSSVASGSRWFVSGIEIRTSGLGEVKVTFCNDGLLNSQGEQLQGTPPNECAFTSWICYPRHPAPEKKKNLESLLIF